MTPLFSQFFPASLHFNVSPWIPITSLYPGVPVAVDLAVAEGHLATNDV